jgi:hypothetical protein
MFPFSYYETKSEKKKLNLIVFIGKNETSEKCLFIFSYKTGSPASRGSSKLIIRTNMRRSAPIKSLIKTPGRVFFSFLWFTRPNNAGYIALLLRTTNKAYSIGAGLQNSTGK